MPTYQKADPSVAEMAKAIQRRYDTYAALLDAGVTIDFVFAFPAYDKNDEPKGDAIRHGGAKALGFCRRLSLKDRAMGRADVEILLDADWWKKADELEQAALLDHEMHHIIVVTNKKGEVQTDDLNRPRISMRPHDYEFGWFAVIAQRHGESSGERRQAKQIVDEAGQFFWPFPSEVQRQKAA